MYKSRGFFVFVTSTMLCLFAVAALAAPKKKKGGTKAASSARVEGAALVFPAKDVFDPDKGSYEALFSPTFSYGDKLATGSSIRTFSFLSIVGPQGSGKGEQGFTFRISMGQQRNSNHMTLSSSRFERLRQYYAPVNHTSCSLNSTNSPPFKAGDWRSVAATWTRTSTNYVLCLYFDGQRMNRTTIPASRFYGNAPIDPKDLLIIGSTSRMRGNLEAVRISNRVRTPEEIMAIDKKGLAKDEHTLLLINAESVSQMKSRSLDILKNQNKRNITVPSEGTIFGVLTEIEGKTTKGIAFP